MLAASDTASDNWGELQRGLVRAVAITYGLATWLLWYRLPTAPRQDVGLVLIAAAVSAACLGAAFSRIVPPWVAACLEVAGPFAAIWFAYNDLGYDTALLFLLVPLLLSSFLLASGGASLLVLVPCCLILRSASPGEGMLMVLALQGLLVGAPCLLAAYGLCPALRRAWVDSANAAALARDVRGRREEVNRLNKALHVANGLLKRSLRELAAAQREAAEARHLKEQFATTVSHELRTPLNVILGFIEVMQTWPEVYGDVNWTPALRRDVNEIDQSARYLSDLVNDILDLARVQALRMPIHRESTQLADLVQEVANMASRLLLDSNSVAIRTECPTDLPPVYVDRTRIRQVLLNLLANACRFTDGGEIVLRLALMDEDVLVSVSDSGPGISSDEIDAIFDEFRQADRPAEERQPWAGKGLGLAIARRFVQIHGGRIWAESRLGVGSTFYFTLPLAQKPYFPAGEPPAPLLVADGGMPSVVLVGDEEARAYLARHLEGYAVSLATDLGSARLLVREQHPDLVIVNAPPPPAGIDEVMAPAVVAEPVAVVHCSLPTSRRHGEPELFDDWIVKPIDGTRLFAALDRYPQGHRVLVVDDDPSFVLLVRRMLETRAGRYRVAWAHDGDEALRQLGDVRPDVVLLDIALPRLNGRTVARAIRTSALAPALIALTAVRPGVDSDEGSPGSFAVTAHQGIGEGSTLELIRSCLVHLKPGYLPAALAEEPGAGPAGPQAS